MGKKAGRVGEWAPLFLHRRSRQVRTCIPHASHLFSRPAKIIQYAPHNNKNPARKDRIEKLIARAAAARSPASRGMKGTTQPHLLWKTSDHLDNRREMDSAALYGAAPPSRQSAYVANVSSGSCVRSTTVIGKLDILTLLPPSETGDSHTPVSDQGECPPPPLALPAQDSVPR